MDAKTLKMISGGAFVVAVLSAIIGFYTLVSFYSSHKMGLPALTVAMSFAIIILPACLAVGCFAKQDKLIGCVLVIMALEFAFSGISLTCAALINKTASISMLTIGLYYFQAISDFLFAVSAILGAVSTLTQKRSKNLCLAFAMIALVATVVGIIGSALALTILTSSTLVVLMEGVGLFALGMSYMKSIGENQAPVQEPSAASLSSAQLSGYKQLLDQGIITQEEFDEQKKRFLQG